MIQPVGLLIPTFNEPGVEQQLVKPTQHAAFSLALWAPSHRTRTILLVSESTMRFMSTRVVISEVQRFSLLDINKPTSVYSRTNISDITSLQRRLWYDDLYRRVVRVLPETVWPPSVHSSTLIIHHLRVILCPQYRFKIWRSMLSVSCLHSFYKETFLCSEEKTKNKLIKYQDKSVNLFFLFTQHLPATPYRPGTLWLFCKITHLVGIRWL